MSVLNFTGDIASGNIDMDKAEMVCVPSKPKYADVDLCLKSGDDGKSGMNLVVAQVVGDWLYFEEKQKLGYEIEKRWNQPQPTCPKHEAGKRCVWCEGEPYTKMCRDNPCEGSR